MAAARAVSIPVLITATLGSAYLAISFSSTDLAAQTFRVELFERQGFVIWNNAWYGGHHVLGYSLLFPPLGALLGVRLAGVLAAIASTWLFAVLARRRFGERALLGSSWFGAGAGAWLLTGRMTFMLGVAIGLGALLAAERRRLPLAGGLAVASAAASPVSGLFVGLAGVAVAVAANRRVGAVLALPATGAVAVLGLAFPTTGAQPFVLSTYLAVVTFCAGTLLLAGHEHRSVRVGVALYALLATLAFAVPTPLGGNVARLGALFAGPVAALLLLGRRRAALVAVLCLPLLYWQLSAPIRDAIKAVGDPSTQLAYYRPLLAALDRVTGGDAAHASGLDGHRRGLVPARIEVPPTENRWEAVYVAPRYPLARGWLRQLESDDFRLFRDGRLDAESYRRWLDANGVSYVAVPDADLDYIAEREVELIASGLDYLIPVWSSEHWRLYRVAGEPPRLARRGIEVDELGADRFRVELPRAGEARLPIRWSPYWQLEGGPACLERDGKWVRVELQEPGELTISARLSFDGVLGRDRVCSG